MAVGSGRNDPITALELDVPDDVPSIWDVDGGAAAESYAGMPYGHYKSEVYPLFGAILDAFGDDVRVLDIGAGPGHLAVEFYKQRRRSRTRFALLDVGKAISSILISSIILFSSYFLCCFSK